MNELSKLTEALTSMYGGAAEIKQVAEQTLHTFITCAVSSEYQCKDLDTELCFLMLLIENV